MHGRGTIMDQELKSLNQFYQIEFKRETMLLTWPNHIKKKERKPWTTKLKEELRRELKIAKDERTEASNIYWRHLTRSITLSLFPEN